MSPSERTRRSLRAGNAASCVRATAVDGLQHDYRVVIPEEAVGDRNPEAHRANLHDLNAKYADVLPLDEVLRRLDTPNNHTSGP